MQACEQASYTKSIAKVGVWNLTIKQCTKLNHIIIKVPDVQMAFLFLQMINECWEFYYLNRHHFKGFVKWKWLAMSII